MKNKIVKCSGCGRHAVTQSKIKLICPYCSKQTKLKKGIYSRVIKEVDSGLEASAIVSNLNAKGKEVGFTK